MIITKHTLFVLWEWKMENQLFKFVFQQDDKERRRCWLRRKIEKRKIVDKEENEEKRIKIVHGHELP